MIAIGYFMALKYDFEVSIGHFARGSVWFYVFSAGIIASVILAAVLAKLSEKKFAIVKFPETNFISVFATVLAAVLAILLLVSAAIDLSFGRVGSFGKYASYLLPFISISLVMAMFSKFRTGTVRLIASSLAAISITLTMFEMYFDFSVPLNSPVRNLSTIANAAVMLFIFSEARITLKADSRRITSKFYIFANASAASLSLGITVGAILEKLFCPIVNDPNMSLLRLGMYAAISLLALSRLFSLPSIAGDIPVKSTEETDAADAVNEETESDTIDQTNAQQ